MSIELPPTPATVEEAVRIANDLAYGFVKNTVEYWAAEYANDPDYYWKRMLGWQANSDGKHPEDVAVYGLYAVPSSPWRTLSIPPVIDNPIDNTPLPAPTVDLSAIDTKINAILTALPALVTKQDLIDLREEFVKAAKQLAPLLKLFGGK